MKAHTETETLEEVAIGTQTEKAKALLIWNDDVTTFDWVIQTLQEVCGHEYIQAVQCAHIVHNTGKCPVKSGTLKKLQPMLWEILERKITATIEEGI
jgi:ATP-dependent Clp protease adaptor protein ClpS